jgi:plastocyanin
MKKMLLVAAAVALTAAACSSSSDDDSQATTSSGESVTTTAASSDAAVSVKDFAFNPGTISVAVGTTITWTNDETGVAHTTTSDDDVWSSGTLQPGDDFTTTFAEPGTFTYFCSIHPSMTATIVVEG